MDLSVELPLKTKTSSEPWRTVPSRRRLDLWLSQSTIPQNIGQPPHEHTTYSRLIDHQAMSTPRSREEGFTHCLRLLEDFVRQEQARSRELDITTRKCDARKEEVRCLRDKQCILERNAERDAAKIAMLKASKALAESVVHKLTASPEKPEGGEQHRKKKAEKFIKRIGDLEQTVEKQASQEGM